MLTQPDYSKLICELHINLDSHGKKILQSRMTHKPLAPCFHLQCDRVARVWVNDITKYQDCVHMMPAHFENGEKCDGSKLGASVHTMPEQFENDRKFDSKILFARL